MYIVEYEKDEPVDNKQAYANVPKAVEVLQSIDLESYKGSGFNIQVQDLSGKLKTPVFQMSAEDFGPVLKQVLAGLKESLLNQRNSHAKSVDYIDSLLGRME